MSVELPITTRADLLSPLIAMRSGTFDSTSLGSEVTLNPCSTKYLAICLATSLCLLCGWLTTGTLLHNVPERSVVACAAVTVQQRALPYPTEPVGDWQKA